MLKILVCMYGLCFNPQQIVSLDDRSYWGKDGCRINLSRGQYQTGSDHIFADGETCEQVTKEINEAAHDNQQ